MKNMIDKTKIKKKKTIVEGKVQNISQGKKERENERQVRKHRRGVPERALDYQMPRVRGTCLGMLWGKHKQTGRNES